MQEAVFVNHIYNRAFEETSRRCRPVSALFELTYSCNTRCEHCYLTGFSQRQAGATDGELTTREIYSILEQMAEAGVLFLSFSGGEPLLRRDFFEIAKKARDLGFALRIFTNGTLVDKKTASGIAGLDPIEVEVSIYGASAGTHDGVTHIPGSFDETIQGAENLLKEGVRVNFKALLMRSNHMEHQDMEALAEKMGVRFFYNTQIVPRDNGDRRPVALNMDSDSLLALYTNTSAQKIKEKAILRRRRQTTRPICNSGRNTLAISPYGDVYPCVQIRWSAGNLKKEGFTDIWKSSPVLRKIRRLCMKDLNECMSCALFDSCSHCPGVSFLETGNFLGCSPLAKSQASALHTALKRGDMCDWS